MNLREETEKIKLDGYNEANAESKLCQDIVLKAISESGMGRNRFGIVYPFIDSENLESIY